MVNLDSLYYDGGWNPAPAEEFAVIQHELVACDRWLIEGSPPQQRRSAAGPPG